MDERMVKSMRDGVKKIPTPILIAVVVVLVFLFAKPWVEVGPGQRGVVLNFGAVQDYVLGEGLHFRIPVVQEVILLDVRVQKVVTDTIAASSDLQDVTSSIALNYHLIPDKANIVYQTIGISYRSGL